MTDGITFDKPNYAPGALITATVTNSKRIHTSTLTGVDDAGDAETGVFTVTRNQKYSDTDGRTWTVVSDAGGVSVVTATA